ncbi:MAG: lysylphosphatidylglycerol synthase transmembrane domain-containing protein, partial [Candidatus Micrarchaeia archaeon]
MKLAKLKRFLPFLIGVAIFLFAGGKVGWSEVFRIISTANLTLIAAVMLFTIVEFAVKSWRQSLFLKKISKTEFGPVKSAQIFSIGIFANEFLPAGTGELLRAYIIKRLAKVGFGKPLAPLLIERSFDTFFLLSVALLGINLLFAEQVSAAGASLLLVVLLSIFFFTAIFKKSFGVKIVRLFSFLKKTFLSGFYKALEKTSLSFEEMRKIYAKDKVLLMQTFLLTVLVWSFEAFVQQILFS